MLTEKRIREIVREEIRLEKKREEIELEHSWQNRSGDYPFISPAWSEEVALPKTRHQVKESLAQKD
jgi:hypothetical protein